MPPIGKVLQMLVVSRLQAHQFLIRFLIKKTSKSKYYYFLRTLVLLKQISLEIIIYDEVLLQNNNGYNGTILQRTPINLKKEKMESVLFGISKRSSSHERDRTMARLVGLEVTLPLKLHL